MPTVRASTVRYRPHPDGSVQVEAAVVERPLLPHGWLGAAGLAARALPERELSLPVASPTGGGALLTLRWRWWENRPLLGAGLAAPGALGLPGVLAVEGWWERQAYVTSANGSVRDTVVEERRHAAFGISDWLTGTTRVGFGVGIDRWGEGPLRPAARVGAEIRLADDRVAVTAHGAHWPAVSAGDGFAALDLGAFWRAGSDATGTQWRGRIGLALTSSASPLSLRPGAGTGHARGPLLRAHPLLNDGLIRRERIGRALLHGGAEVTRWLGRWGPAAGGLALFIDSAKPLASDITGAEASLLVDAGVGVRLQLPWKGRLRADVGLDLRDGGTAASVAWEEPWPAGVGGAHR